MIWESWYWKKPLLETAVRLKELKAVADPSEEQLVQVEKDIFIGFYSVRKLFDSVTKITDATKNSTLQLAWYANVRPVSWRNNHRLDELYDLSRQHWETRDAWFVCSRIIHSFVFAPMFGDKGIEAILFTSDTDKDKKLYSLPIDSVIDLFERVGNDDPQEIKWRRDQETGEESTVVK
jgi:hypothetical protein